MNVSKMYLCVCLSLRQPLFRAAASCVFVFCFLTLSSAQKKTANPPEFDHIAAQADRARDGEDLENAQILYRRALAIRPGWAEGWWSLGTILYDRDKYPEAARAFAKVVSLQPQHGSARVMLGLCEFDQGQDASALRDIESGKQLGVVEDAQLRHVMLYHEGVLLLRKGSFEAAQQALDSLGQEGVEDGDLILALGMAVLRIRPDGLPPEGSNAREIVLRVGEAESMAASKNFDAARREYCALATDYTETANIHYAYGRFLLEMREIEPAVVEFQHEIQNNPRHALARFEIAAVRYRVDSASGIKYAEEAVKLDPQRPFGHYLLGLLYLDTHNYAGAISELEIAKRAHPNMPEIYFALGNAYARADRKLEAARARATFTRLNSQTKKGAVDKGNDVPPSGLTPGQFEPEMTPKIPE